MYSSFDVNSVTFDSLNDEEKAEVLENMGYSFWKRDGYVRAYIHFENLIYLFDLGEKFDFRTTVYAFLRSVNIESDELRFAHFLANHKIYYSFNTHKWSIEDCSIEKFKLYGIYVINKLIDECNAEAKKMVFDRLPENVLARFAKYHG